MHDHPALDRLARAGRVAYGLVYGLVAWLAAALALGDRQGTPSGQGAFQQLAEDPVGRVTLWLVAAGLAGLAVDQAVRVVRGPDGSDGPDGADRWAVRAGCGGRTVVLGLLTVLAVRSALGDGGGGRRTPQGVTVALLDLPVGPAIVVALGVGIVGVGAISAVKGLGDGWRDDLEVDGQTGATGTVISVLARAGYLSRGAAFAVIGVLFAWAGVTHDPSRSGGLDQAVVRFRDEPYGRGVILVVAVGLACYGAYHVARAWYLRGR
ncbi:DUF1206 domain-containing protein [Nocardioides sp. LHD-245]|uniref:DUF1206 domain-containing protein n=1 Tax=Nocardioides sp. LHD-245 TaxID=3051387 RepID=UPI0027DFC2D1|nr:DUF1206 domain-containing protein [Nocardioides sp. LHD-245]